MNPQQVCINIELSTHNITHNSFSYITLFIYLNTKQHPLPKVDRYWLVFRKYFQVRDAGAGILETGDVALPRILVTRERVTVTGLVTGVIMMVTGAAEGIWCAGPTTASSLGHTSIPRMTAAKTLMVVEVCIKYIVYRM